MVSQNKRYVISYNGEIYNYKILTSKLNKEGVFLKSRSDTEVILECISKWGIKNSIPLFIGMFAIAIWDKKTEKLHLVRDRLGIKPLYWGFINENFVFSSTLDSIFTFPNWNKEINKVALNQYLLYG